MAYDVAFVGTGPEPENPVWGESAAMAYRHGEGYRQLDACDLVACADLVRENAAAFADAFDIDRDLAFEDYGELLAEVEPDIVSVATPVPTHADIVVDVAASGVVDAVHCEKPMADTWGDARRMADACDDAGVQLTFNHQRRFGPPWRRAKDLLDDGAIGELERVEMGGKNLLDYGTHLIDLCNFFNDERGAEWVLCGLDYREADVRYGTHNENQAIALWEYGNGVHGLASTGFGRGHEAVGAHHRLLGTAGTIEVETDDDVTLRVRRGGDGWEHVEVADTNQIDRAIAHVVECLDSGDQPVLSAEHALRATEIIYGAWEAVRSRGRVEFPLDIEDNPLEDMVERGDLDPS